MSPSMRAQFILKSTDTCNRQIRLGKVRHPKRDIAYWITFGLEPEQSPFKKHQHFLEKFYILLEVICDECLALPYRQLGLRLINYPLFELRELEAEADLTWQLRKQIILTNRAVFYEFKQTFKFFKLSLGE